MILQTTPAVQTAPAVETAPAVQTAGPVQPYLAGQVQLVSAGPGQPGPAALKGCYCIL